MTKDEAYYNSLDKRTNEYKNWKAKQPSQGLGDTIEKVAKATGIDKLVKFIAGEDCGCEERKEKLNEMFAYRRKPKCLVEDELNTLKDFFDANPKLIKPSERLTLNNIHLRVFGYAEGDCDGCVRTMVSNLRIVYESYSEND